MTMRGTTTVEPVMAAGRVPPNDLDSEAAVLSAVMLSRDAFDLVNELLSPDHFYSEANRRVFEAILDLQRTMRAIDVISVAAWLKDRERLQQIGGTPYLAQLTDATPAVANVETHARIVREKYRLRQLIGTCQRFAAEGYGDCGEVQAFIDRAEQSIFDIARVAESSNIVPLRDAVVEAFKILNEATQRGGGITGIATGFTQLDRMTAGMHAGDLYIVAGRPGMGKTSFVLNLALNVARPRAVGPLDPNDPYGDNAEERPGYGVAFFSLEMPKEQLAARLLASEARVNMSDIRKGALHPKDWSKLTESAARLGSMPVWLDDTPAIGLLDLRAKIRRLQAEISRSKSDGRPHVEKMGLVAIDYLQLMHGRQNANSREQEISELSRGLKQLAKELSVPVIALSQLNRAVETRNTKDKRPQLSDLRESGAIEQDADAIIFIYRDDYYNEDSEDKGIAEIIIAKQRNGPTGTVKTRFTAAYTRFDNLETDDYYDQMQDIDAAIDGP
ncbi:MAG TPA: replicative DNA helicase [Polyangiaceae bacterium]